MSKRNNILLIIAAMFLAVSAAVGVRLIWQEPLNRIELLLEERAIEQAANCYLNAEAKGDRRLAYDMLAPSSAYRKTHSYDEYLRDIATYPPVQIGTYRIVGIYRLRANDDRRAYPGVDKFVQVEVDVTFSSTGSNSVYNYSFTFLKEKGAWYKG